MLLTAMAVLLLVACGAPPATPTPPLAPSPAPTASPAPSLGPSGEFTPGTPLVATRLPAPLFVLQSGQIARIERDAVTRAVITAESVQLPGVEAIAEFAAAPGRLAYIVGDVEADRLVLTDDRGQGATTRYSEVGHELSDLLFTPSGDALLLRLLNNRQPPDLPSGLYRLPLRNGPLELLQADDPVDDPANPSRTTSGYRPVAFSPNGTTLLLEVFSQFYEDCTLGVMPAAGGPVTRLTLPAGEAVYCGEQAWSADGSTFLFLAGPVEGLNAGPRLWRADASADNPEPLQPSEAYGRVPHGVDGPAAHFFLATLVRDATGAITGASFAPSILAAPGAAPQQLAEPVSGRLDLALWAPDGAGVVAAVVDERERASLSWLRLDGPPVEFTAADSAVAGLAWGAEAAGR